MKPPRAHIRLQGLGADKQLLRLQQMGYTLFDIQKAAPDTLDFGYDAAAGRDLHAYLTDRGFIVTPLPPRGTARRLRLLKSLLPLAVFFLSAMLALSLAARCIWRIEITGAGPYIGEVRAFLREENICEGCLIRRIDPQSLSEKLTFRLPRVAWVRVSLCGLTLSVEITQGVPAPDTHSSSGNGHIIADRDCVIEALHVYAGTAAVQTGDAVKAGDVLIYGHERAQNGTLRPVRARGKITGCSYLTETVRISALSLQSCRTGKSTKMLYLALPFLRLPLSPSPQYLTSEYESVFLPLGGAWFPLQIEKRTVFELYLQPDDADTVSIKEEGARLALQNLLIHCGEHDEIIDKWLYYSMIEGGILSATVTALIRTQIGLFSPETPE